MDLVARVEMSFEDLVAVYGVVGTGKLEPNSREATPPMWKDNDDEMMMGLNRKVS